MTAYSTFQDVVEHTKERRIDFFRLVFGDESGYICIAYKSHLDSSMREKYFYYPTQLTEMCADIDKNSLTLTHVYFCPQLFEDNSYKRSGDGKGPRVKENVKTCPVLWADLDTCGPHLLQVPASIVVQSSKGRWQAFWRMDEALHPADAEALCMKIAYFHSEQGADRSGWDLTQLMRVPYTPNYKYGDLKTAPIVAVLKTSSALYRPSDFEVYPQYEALKFVDNPMPLPEDLPQEAALEILQRYRSVLNPQVFSLFSTELGDGDDWSKVQWKLAKLCSEAGMSPEETFVVVRDAACNKYARDGRPAATLWTEIKKVYVKEYESHNLILTPSSIIPELITDEELRIVQGSSTFIERYIRWASDLTDAAPQYHQAGAFTILSAILSGSVRLNTSFGVVIPNMWFMILADTAQPLYYPILTPSGWQKMGELNLFDEVIGSDGKPTTIIGIQERGIIDNYEVTFKDGSTVECSNDHLWTTKLYTGNYVKTVPLSKIREALNSGYNPRIPVLTGPVEFNELMSLQVDPYVLGVWLAEGSCSRYYVEFSSNEDEIVNKIKSRVEPELRVTSSPCSLVKYIRTTNDNRHGPNSNYNYIREGLKELNLLDKNQQSRFIPEEYLIAAIEDRLELLRGILDGDGSIAKNGTIRISLTCEKLIDDVISLVKSLGGTATKIQCNRLTTAGKTVWQSSIKMPIGLNPFSLSRKAKLFKGSEQLGWKAIEKIEHIGQEEMRCILVSNADGLYVTNDYIVTHNTLTRKSTAMDIAMELLAEVSPNAIMATDGTPEGILSALKDRTRQPSIYFRDEFTGLLEAITNKDYMAGMAEQFTKLYDGKTIKRLLRKEEIRITEPRFIMFTGGIKTKTQALLNEEHVNSGFIPRFVFITAVADPSRVRPVGPPINHNQEGKARIKDELFQIDDNYNRPRMIVLPDGKTTANLKPEFEVILSNEAWIRYNRLETLLTSTALTIGIDHLTPVYDRLAKSTLKAAILIAASKQGEHGTEVKVELEDILHAIYYCKHWYVYANEIVSSIGKNYDERTIDSIMKFVTNAGMAGVSRSDIMRAFHLDARRAELLLTTIIQRRLVFMSHFSGQPRYVGID